MAADGMTTPFTSYQFAATSAPTLRTMPDRLNDIINVKDWGAKGDGVSDDTQAIRNAILYAYSICSGLSGGNSGGSIVFLPPGTYMLINNLPLELAKLDGTQQGNLYFVGSGKNATILKGNYAGGYIVQKADTGNDSLMGVFDMTIWNQSTTASTGALVVPQHGAQLRLSNLKLIGFNGLQFRHDVYATMIDNITAECSAAIGAANSGSPGPPHGGTEETTSIGLHNAPGLTINCKATGFDIGISAHGSGGGCIIGFVASRCNIGIDAGGNPTPGQNAQYLGSILGCTTDRCKWGIRVWNMNGSMIASSVITGTEGPAGAAMIQGMSWDNVTHVVTVTSPAHNLPGSPTTISLSTNPATWTPNGTGTQLVVATNTGANTFTYPGPSSDPGSFTSGTWNYPIEYGITIRDTHQSTYIANMLPAMASIASFDTTGAGTPSFNERSEVIAMNAPYGWAMQARDQGAASGWTFLNCDIPPFVKMVSMGAFGGPGALEGMEFNIVDGQTQNAFGGTVTGGGTKHYKVRYNGTNWVRVG
jgi:hypothetical protein